MAIVKKLGRYCTKCGARFEPLGKFQKVCLDCQEGIRSREWGWLTKNAKKANKSNSRKKKVYSL